MEGKKDPFGIVSGDFVIGYSPSTIDAAAAATINNSRPNKIVNRKGLIELDWIGG